MENRMQETEYLKAMHELEDLANKKANIYARLFLEPAFAKQMEELALRHEQRKQKIEELVFGEKKSKSKANEGGMSAMNRENAK